MSEATAREQADPAVFEEWDTAEKAWNAAYRKYNVLYKRYNAAYPADYARLGKYAEFARESIYRKSGAKDEERNDLLRRSDAAADAWSNTRDRYVAARKAWDDACGFVRLLP